MKIILLSQQGKNKFLKLFVKVDDEDYDWLNQWRWHAHKEGRNGEYFYAMRTNGKIKIRMHRLIMNVNDKNILVDHINRDTLDNQKSNLRPATHSQNQANKISSPKSKSKYKGVSWNIAKNKWQAHIAWNKKQKMIGIFENEMDAALAYNEAAIKLQGEFANLNKL